jgi:hypothetical protein
VRTLPRLWRRLDLEQRVAAGAAVALAVSTIGPFSFVEAAVLLVSGAVGLLLVRRAEGGRFHLPFGDGSVLAAAGAWSAVLILTRAFDRSAGQTLLALACAGVLVLVGIRQRRRRPRDDVPTEHLRTESRPRPGLRGDDERGSPDPGDLDG